MTDERDGRAQRMWRSLRKETPAALGDADSHDDAEVAVMLRELGIALLEVEQPTQLVAGRLISIAKRYTHHTVRIVALPSALVVQLASSENRRRREPADLRRDAADAAGLRRRAEDAHRGPRSSGPDGREFRDVVDAARQVLGQTVAAVFSIALGTLAGFSIFHAFGRPTRNRVD